MIIGTVRAEEAKVKDSEAGFHKFTTEDGEGTYGSFEVFWHDGGSLPDAVKYTMASVALSVDEALPAGWYWWARFPGCLPDSDMEPDGPHASSIAARVDADGNWLRGDD